MCHDFHIMRQPTSTKFDDFTVLLAVKKVIIRFSTFSASEKKSRPPYIIVVN